MQRLSDCIAALILEQTDETNKDLKKDEQFPIFPEGEVRIGRDASKCSPVIQSNIVSKQHFRIYNVIFEDEEGEKNPPLIYCEDLESVNGTWVNDTLIGKIGSPMKGYLLGDGDLIQIKPHWAFRFHQNFSEIENLADEVQTAEMQHFADRYTVENRVLGSGQTSRVHLAYDNFTRTQLACKIVNLRSFIKKVQRTRDEVSPEFFKPPPPREHIQKPTVSQELSRILQEVDILSKLSHPNIVSLKKAFRSESTLFLFQELATGGDLLSYLERQGGKLNDLHSRIITRQVALAVQYLHSRGIAHRDLKPENILVTNTDIGHRVLVTDFGSATSLANKLNRLKSVVGTLGYVAPEVKKTGNGGYTKAIDMWSLGIVATCLLTGELLVPQHEVRQHQLESENKAMSAALSRNISKMLEGKWQWEDVGVRARDFVQRLLVINAAERMTADQALNHYWFTRPKEVAEEIEKLYGRATKYWSPRSDTKVLEELPEIQMEPEASTTNRDTARRPSKRQKRLPDCTTSAYFGLDNRLRTKSKGCSERKELMAKRKNLVVRSPSQMFLVDVPRSTNDPHTTRKVESKKVPGNNLFGPHSPVTDPIDHAKAELEPQTQVSSNEALDQVTGSPSSILANSRLSKDTQSTKQNSQLRHPKYDSVDPRDFQGTQETNDGKQESRDPYLTTYISPEDFQYWDDTKDDQETLFNQDSDSQESPEPYGLLGCEDSIDDVYIQDEGQQQLEEVRKKHPPFGSARLLLQKMTEQQGSS